MVYLGQFGYPLVDTSASGFPCLSRHFKIFFGGFPGRPVKKIFESARQKNLTSVTARCGRLCASGSVVAVRGCALRCGSPSGNGARVRVPCAVGVCGRMCGSVSRVYRVRGPSICRAGPLRVRGPCPLHSRALRVRGPYVAGPSRWSQSTPSGSVVRAGPLCDVNRVTYRLACGSVALPPRGSFDVCQWVDRRHHRRYQLPAVPVTGDTRSQLRESRFCIKSWGGTNTKQCCDQGNSTFHQLLNI